MRRFLKRNKATAIAVSQAVIGWAALVIVMRAVLILLMPIAPELAILIVLGWLGERVARYAVEPAHS